MQVQPFDDDDFEGVDLDALEAEGRRILSQGNARAVPAFPLARPRGGAGQAPANQEAGDPAPLRGFSPHSTPAWGPNCPRPPSSSPVPHWSLGPGIQPVATSPIRLSQAANPLPQTSFASMQGANGGGGSDGYSRKSTAGDAFEQPWALANVQWQPADPGLPTACSGGVQQGLSRGTSRVEKAWQPTPCPNRQVNGQVSLSCLPFVEGVASQDHLPGREGASGRHVSSGLEGPGGRGSSSGIEVFPEPAASHKRLQGHTQAPNSRMQGHIPGSSLTREGSGLQKFTFDLGLEP